MSPYVIVAVVGVLALVILAAAVRILKQYERGVQFRLGRLRDGPRGPGVARCVATCRCPVCRCPGVPARRRK